MAARIILAPQAEIDLDDAYGWYETQRMGLGEEFLSCADACIQRISRFPEMNEKVFAEYRRALVRRFPYMVFYEFENATVRAYPRSDLDAISLFRVDLGIPLTLN